MVASPDVREHKIVPKSSRARAQFQDFKARTRAMQAEVARTPLFVLLWNPGGFNPILHNKRGHILKELRRRGIAAYFSEKLERLKNDRLSSDVNDILQAQNADLVVVIAQASQSFETAKEFAINTAIKNKLAIFVPDPVSEAFRADAAYLREKYDSVKTYNYPNDVGSCHLKAAVLDKVSEMQLAKWRASNSTDGA